MDSPKLVTIKVTEDTRRMLRILSAHHNVNLYDVAEALCWADMKKHRLRVPKKKETK